MEKSSLVFYQSSYDFGDILINNDARTVFYFVNNEQVPIQIQDVQTTCGCTVPIWPKEVIKPDKRGQIIVAYDAKKSGYFKERISVFYNGNDSLKTLTIKGNVVSKISDKDRTNNAIRNAVLKEYPSSPKLKIFTKPQNLLSALETESSFDFTEWQHSGSVFGGKRWSAHTAIKQIGSTTKNGVQTDIGYQVFGKEQDFVNEIKINLNIKNDKEKKEAFIALAELTKLTFTKLNIEIPGNLNSNILKGEHYYFENSLCYILLLKKKSEEENLAISKYPSIKPDKVVDVETFNLVIKSK